MWTLISVVLLVATCINGDITMLQASGIFAIAAAVDRVADKLRRGN